MVAAFGSPGCISVETRSAVAFAVAADAAA